MSSSQLQSFYQEKKVFVTGHTGFKGSWLVASLQMMGAIVKGYALQPEFSGSLYQQLQNNNQFDSVIADIRDRNRLTQELLSFQPDYIFHLAAQPLVRRSYEIPAETFEVNVIGTANLLEAAQQLSHPCSIVVITTDKVYENKEQNILYKEDDMLGGYDPYSASKACTELVVSSFRNSFFNPHKYAGHQKAITSVRAGNVIGGGDWSRDRIIPDIVRSLQRGDVIEVRNPHAVRPWQHVLEPVAGYLLLGGLLQQEVVKFSRPFNFGPLPDDHLSVKELVEKSVAVWGNGQWKDVSVANQPHEAGLLKLDISRALDELEWKPKLDASKAIQWTIGWYKQPTEEQLSYTFQQIKDYFSA